MNTNNITNVASVRSAWGRGAPEWIVVLAAACDSSSQAAIARRLNVSGAQVNQVLRHSYQGRLDRIERRVRGELMRDTAICPVLGRISTKQCEDEQQQPFSTSSRLRVAVYHACRGGCPNFKGRKEAV